MVRLEGYEDRRPGQLSGGQQQRVALARALVLEPPVLLLDEPLGALDARLRLDLQVELKRIQEQLGVTFIYVTHDQDEALTMSDRVAVMRDGKDRAVRRAAAALRGRRRPRSSPTSSARRTSCRWPSQGGGRLLSSATSSCAPISASSAQGDGAGDDPAGERPAGASTARTGENRVPGMVEDVVYLGFHQEVRVRLATGVAASRSTSRTTTSRPSTSRATRSPCTCRARHLRVLAADSAVPSATAVAAPEEVPAG